MVDVMRRALWLFGVPLIALASGVVGFFSVFVMGLVMPLFMVGPLSLISGACLDTLCSGWLANFARWDQSRSRLLAILGISLIGAVLTLPPYWGAAWLVNALYSPPNLAPIGVIYYSPYMAGAVVFVAITASAVWKLRLSTQRGLTGDFRLTLLLLVALPTLIVGTMFAGYNLTYCGA